MTLWRSQPTVLHILVWFDRLTTNGDKLAAKNNRRYRALIYIDPNRGICLRLF